MVQASPSTIGAPLSLVLVGTRNSTLANAFFALRLATGVEAWRFTNSAAQGGTGLGMGIIGGQATVDAATSRVYFASRARAGGSPNTVWCVQLTATAPTLVWARNVGDVDGSTTLRNGRLYVGTNAGTVHALDANTGADLWTAPFATGDGAVKGFIWPVRGSTRLYFTTTNNVWAVDDAGASPTSPWAQPLAVAAPSLPLFSGAFLYVGSGDGRLYEIDPLGGTRSVEIVSGGVAGVGSPSMDFQSSVIYVGSEAGNVYSVAVPLP
jgi:outer membrane protein assembly factor BamB